MLVNFRIDENLALVQVVPGLDFRLGIDARDPVLVVDFQDVAFFFLAFRHLRIDHGHVGIVTAVEMEHFLVIDILHQIAAGRQDVRAVAALDEKQILIERMDIPFDGMDDIFHVGWQIEQAVPFAGQSPFLPRADVVQYGAGLGRQEDTYVADPGVYHIGKSEINEAELASHRHGRQRAVFIEFRECLAVL